MSKEYPFLSPDGQERRPPEPSDESLAPVLTFRRMTPTPGTHTPTVHRVDAAPSSDDFGQELDLELEDETFRPQHELCGRCGQHPAVFGGLCAACTDLQSSISKVVHELSDASGGGVDGLFPVGRRMPAVAPATNASAPSLLQELLAEVEQLPEERREPGPQAAEKEGLAASLLEEVKHSPPGLKVLPQQPLVGRAPGLAPLDTPDGGLSSPSPPLQTLRDDSSSPTAPVHSAQATSPAYSTKRPAHEPPLPSFSAPPAKHNLPWKGGAVAPFVSSSAPAVESARFDLDDIVELEEAQVARPPSTAFDFDDLAAIEESQEPASFSPASSPLAFEGEVPGLSQGHVPARPVDSAVYHRDVRAESSSRRESVESQIREKATPKPQLSSSRAKEVDELLQDFLQNVDVEPKPAKSSKRWLLLGVALLLLFGGIGGVLFYFGIF